MSEQHPYRHPYVPTSPDFACASCGWKPKSFGHGRAHVGPSRVYEGSARVPACKCGVKGVRDEDFDAYYCPASGVWLEEKCHESERCQYCAGRPEKRRI